MHHLLIASGAAVLTVLKYWAGTRNPGSRLIPLYASYVAPHEIVRGREGILKHGQGRNEDLSLFICVFGEAEKVREGKVYMMGSDHSGVWKGRTAQSGRAKLGFIRLWKVSQWKATSHTCMLYLETQFATASNPAERVSRSQ